MNTIRNFVISAAVLLQFSFSQAADPLLVPARDKVAGRTQVEWSVLWWQWARSFSQDDSPVSDRSGAMCASRQSGNVWFLAGTYGTQRTIRTCRVPAGKYLFFPLVNFVVYPPVGSQANCFAMMSRAALMTDGASALILEVDGERFNALESHRLASTQCFDLGARTDPPFRMYPSASNGYYAMLRPLSPGRHIVNFGGVLATNLQAVTYTLEIE